MRAGAARHSCAVSHRLFTEQELTFPQSRPHPEGKRKARPRTCLERTPTGTRCPEPARPGQAQGRAGAGPPPYPPAHHGVCAGTRGRNQDAHRMGFSPQEGHCPPHPPGPGPWASGGQDPGEEPRQTGGWLRVPHRGPGLSSCLSSQTFCARRSRRAGACKCRGEGWSPSRGTPPNPLLWGLHLLLKTRPQGAVPKASAGPAGDTRSPAWALPSAPGASGCTRTPEEPKQRQTRPTAPGASDPARPAPHPRRLPSCWGLGARAACTQTPPGPSADPVTPP